MELEETKAREYEFKQKINVHIQALNKLAEEALSSNCWVGFSFTVYPTGIPRKVKLAASVIQLSNQSNS